MMRRYRKMSIGFWVTFGLICGISWAITLYIIWYWAKHWINDKYIYTNNDCVFILDNFILGWVIVYGAIVPAIGGLLAMVWFVSLPALLVIGSFTGIMYHLRHNKRIEKKVSKLEEKA